jgi:RNA polymerase sigma-70 factor (ECF subfamily)
MMISAHVFKTASGPEPLGLDQTIATGCDASAAALSDDVLVNRIARGEQAALCALMARHQVRISRFVRRFVSDRSLVEDLVCDTFFAAWQQAPHFENRSSVATWLMAIARYKALSARERQTLPTEPLDEVLATTIVETGLQPDAVVERDDWARFLRQCLNSLPAEQAQLIELVYYRDKSIKEVALLMGIPENTVKSRMFLARKKLAAMLNAAEVASESIALALDPTPIPVIVQCESPQPVSAARSPQRGVSLSHSRSVAPRRERSIVFPARVNRAAGAQH